MNKRRDESSAPLRTMWSSKNSHDEVLTDSPHTHDEDLVLWIVLFQYTTLLLFTLVVQLLQLLQLLQLNRRIPKRLQIRRKGHRGLRLPRRRSGCRRRLLCCRLLWRCGLPQQPQLGGDRWASSLHCLPKRLQFRMALQRSLGCDFRFSQGCCCIVLQTRCAGAERWRRRGRWRPRGAR
jgi:hypothetical protein